MKIRYKIWIERDDKVLFGRGRDDILKALDEEKSLNAAAKKLGMSYRAAWGRLKASQERMGIELVRSGEGRKSLELMEQTRAIIDRFEKLEKDVETLLADAEADFHMLFEEKT
ncbi:MAG: LysR family transcriptional regulator [Syntrophales bacterium]|jgi:molybdate transport system regulatory protein|nr:LysR family transcriptional regulator [Syntrophales bacterium]MCK9527067.1 LysR family transcriptional regulator [Syntrophales bacterium]MDX9921808.1 LysR family transcriptional regulator [Syntrophales bacterium]